jgi:hypothetical protein
MQTFAAYAHKYTHFTRNAHIHTYSHTPMNTRHPQCTHTYTLNTTMQAEVMGNSVTWLVPHQLAQVLPTDVDYKVCS